MASSDLAALAVSTLADLETTAARSASPPRSCCPPGTAPKT
jgi:hypothetical protein